MASSSFFHKPELALRRALELEGIHQDDAALALLHEVLSSRRHRTWSPAYEQIMIAYIDLCLKMFRSREAKDGLHQYRNLAQSQAPGSLEKVIRYLMEKAEQKCGEAKAFVDAENLAIETAGVEGAEGAVGGGDDEDDGEDAFAASPQAILLSTMSTPPSRSGIRRCCCRRSSSCGKRTGPSSTFSGPTPSSSTCTTPPPRPPSPSAAPTSAGWSSGTCATCSGCTWATYDSTGTFWRRAGPTRPTPRPATRCEPRTDM
jgi:hypothetical protein